MNGIVVMRGGFAALALVVLAGCETSLETCDPNRVDNVLTSYSCQNQGMYQQRQANLSSNLTTITQAVEKERIAISQANSRLSAAEAAGKVSAEQARSLDRQIAALNADVDRLERTGGQNAAQQAALKQQIEQRKRAINDYTNVVLF